jgi:hypothetical protein
MKIELHECRPFLPQTIEEFADKHDLVMEVHERASISSLSHRYYAHFKRAELREENCLVGAHGNGVDPKSAITSYARRISQHLLVINGNKEIHVPFLS